MKDLLIDDCCMLMDVADITGYAYENLFEMAMAVAEEDLEGKCPYTNIDIVHNAFNHIAEVAMEQDF